MKVSINIVIYNGLKYIKPCFDSILNQSFKDFEIIAIDNNSSDNSIKFIKENYPSIRLIQNAENVGFAKAHNQAINLNNSDYILVTNQDIVLEYDFLEKLVTFMDNNLNYGSCGGKLMKMIINEQSIIQKTNVIDCIGLDHSKGYRFFNLGEGSKDIGQFNKDTDIFGVTGALALYRRSSLEKIKDANSYFDERFFMYKEDIDLAWRLNNNNLNSRYISNALAYHERGFSGNNNQNIVEKIKRKNKDKEFLAHLSYRNHLLMLDKNLKKIDIFVFVEELKKIFYYLIFKNKIFFKAISEYKKIKNR
ncbi:MAG: glycosyltransferase family 2 protein [Patescibacteria group bacterium]